MNRSQLEHIIRAAAGNAHTNDIVVIGSQAILGAFSDAPSELLVSIEADVFPRDRPDDAIHDQSFMISSPVFESRFPVGSSARMMDGSFTKARAIATR